MITIAKFDEFDSNGNPIETKWHSLFKKAWTTLSKGDGQTSFLTIKDQEAASEGKISFDDIQHYLSYIESLITIDPIYLMLPIDETPFFIDANTREINVPTEFQTCSGVKSDNYAEIVTFTVDRYFDYKDLSDSTIAVQWKNAAGAEGISIVQLIDLETYGKENRIRFGWPLTEEMTAAAGPLQFAVRFFTKKDGEFQYLLNTTVATIPIKDTLELTDDIFNNANQNDYSHFVNFIKNSQNPYYGEAGTVTFYVQPPAETSLEKDNTQIIRAQAVASDLNPVVYQWYFESDMPYLYNPLNDKGENDWPLVKPNKGTFYTVKEIDGEISFEKIADDYEWPEANPNDLYVTGLPQIIGNNSDRFEILTDDSVYSKYKYIGEWPTSRPALSFWTKDEDGMFYPYSDEEDWPTEEIDLYVKHSCLKITNTNKDIIGKYFVKAINNKTDRDTLEMINSSETVSDICEINPPDDLVAETNLPSGKFLDKTNSNNNIINLKLKSDNANPVRTYKIYKDDIALSDDWKEDIKENTIPNYTVTEAGTYRFYVKSEANRVVKKDSALGGKITFYDLPSKPSANVYIKRTNDESYSAEQHGILININGEPQQETFIDEKGLYNGSYEKITDESTGEVMHIAMFGKGTDEMGTTYVLTLERSDDIKISGNNQTISYNWEKQENGKYISISANSVSKDGDISGLEPLMDENNNVIGTRLKIKVIASDAEVSYRCIITNDIKIDGVGEESTSSDTYIFKLN